VRRFQHVHADIDQRPAALQVLAPEHAPRRDPAAAQRLGADVEHPAERPRFDLPADHLRPGIEAVLEADDQLLPAGGGRVDHLARVAGVHRHRLLDQHVLPRLQRRDRVLGMNAVGRADADRVDIRLLQHAPVVGEEVGDAELLLRPGQRPFADVGDGRRADVRHRLEVAHLVREHPARADEGEVQRPLD